VHRLLDPTSKRCITLNSPIRRIRRAYTYVNAWPWAGPLLFRVRASGATALKYSRRYRRPAMSDVSIIEPSGNLLTCPFLAGLEWASVCSYWDCSCNGRMKN
jgi:hypothetical protein